MQSTRFLRRSAAAVAAMAAAIFGLAVVSQPADAVQTAQDQVVSANPANFTPNVLNGSVKAIAQVGSQIVLGGDFTQAQASAAGSPVLTRNNILAFNATSGAVSTSFVPTVNGTVEALVAAPDGQSVYVGGRFTQVNGVTQSRVARLSISNGQPVAGFGSVAFNGIVRDMRLHANGNLIVGGAFSTVGGQNRAALASLNANSGALTSFVNHNIQTTRTGSRQVTKMDLSPNGSRLAIIGNITSVDGASRPQIAVLNTSGGTSALADWQTDFYSGACASVFDTYMRDLDIDPSGKYMVVSTTGAYGGPDSPCDVISRFELDATGAGQTPTWRNYTGGDTTYAVVSTGSVIYAGGHMRWVNNPFAGDAAGPGAVPRSGIVALDPQNGLPLSWNPGRARGVGVFDMLATAQGLWVGSDTDQIGGETRRRIALMPLAGGSSLPPEDVGSLPTNVYQLGGTGSGSDPSVLYRVNTGGPALLSADDGPDWADGTGGNYVNTGNNAGWDPVPQVDSSVPDTDSDRAPHALFDSEKWDSGDSPEMTWSFPVPAGRNLSVRLYLGNRCSCTSAVGSRVFDVSIDGNQVLNDLDLVAQYGDQVGHMSAFNVTSDGSVDISFGHVVENPLVNGIEIIDRDVTPGGAGAADTIQRRSLNQAGQAGQTTALPADQAWHLSRGAFLIDDMLYSGWANGNLYAQSFSEDGVTANRQAVNLYGGQFGSDVGNITGMTYSHKRIYYTMQGSNELFWRAFTSESGVVGAARFTATGDIGALQPSRVRGLFASGDFLYFADASSGNLLRVPFADAAVGGAAEQVNSSVDWRTRSLVLWNKTPTPPNQLPTANATAQCNGATCSFSGGGSSDPDGNIESYDWTFGDQATGSGQNAQHTYANPGTYTATLTVTDDRGGTAQDSVSVTVAPIAQAIQFVDSRSNSTNATNVQVTAPNTVQPGDTLVLFVTANRSDATLGTPSGGGWAQATSVDDTTMMTRAWVKKATAADAGAAVSTTVSAQAKLDAQLLVYRGTAASPLADVANRNEPNTAAAHTTPGVTGTPPGSWTVSYWSDKSSGTTGWTLPGSVTQRRQSIGIGSGRITSVTADSGAAGLGGAVSGVTATASAASAKATMITLVLAPGQ